MNIGIVSFGLPPVYNRQFKPFSEVTQIGTLLNKNGHTLHEVSITTPRDAEEGINRLQSAGCECVILYFRHWTRISLAALVARSLYIPIALYSQTSHGFNGTTALTAASAVLHEMPDCPRSSSPWAKIHPRFQEGMEDELMVWIKAVAAFKNLRKSRVMCWGGSYGADIPYTRSDSEFLENVMIAEVMSEEQMVLTSRAEKLITVNDGRIDGMIQWLDASMRKIVRDETMTTSEALKKQAALYIAARDRLKELDEENIAGISVKCHFELSLTEWGCTACFLPAFLPFDTDYNGPRSIVPVACEGDLNGLAGLCILHALESTIPPLFGDFVEYNRKYILMRNCGSSSVYWAARSKDPKANLAAADILPNMHGKSGGAVHYETPEAGQVTVARLFRRAGEFHLAFGRAQILPEDGSSAYSDPWPHTRLIFSTDHELFFQAFPCNHSSLTEGDHCRELQWLCKFWGIKAMRLDREEDLRSLML